MHYLKKPFRFSYFIVIPIIFSLIIPVIIMDIWMEVYHRICFPLCKIPCVKRKNYIQIDRHKLNYLTWLQKSYCIYCGYVNGAVGYWVKIAGDSERYWCSLKHKENPSFIEPKHHKDFVKYNDETKFNEKYK